MYTFAATKAGYAKLWDAAKVLPAHAQAALSAATRINEHRLADFNPVEARTGVPWYMVGCLLYRESSLNFNTYLGNGQPLDRVTTEVPKGRGPFSSFEAGAVDALEHEGMAGIAPGDWTIERVLYWCERFNGQGYFSHGNSPYLWSWTDQYHGGKFTSDGVYDASVWDQQGGIVAILKQMEANGLARFTREPKGPPVTTVPTTTVTVPQVNFAQIETALKTVAGFLPMLSGFLPPPIGEIATIGLPIIENGLNLAAELQSGSGSFNVVIAKHLRTLADQLDPPK